MAFTKPRIAGPEGWTNQAYNLARVAMFTTIGTALATNPQVLEMASDAVHSVGIPFLSTLVDGAAQLINTNAIGLSFFPIATAIPAILANGKNVLDNGLDNGENIRLKGHGTILDDTNFHHFALAYMAFSLAEVNLRAVAHML